MMFEPVCAKQTRPNYSVGSDQDEAEIQYDRWSTQEWKDVNHDVCCHEIQAVKAFHLKFKARLSWITAVLKIFAMEFNCVGNHFLEEFFSEIS